MSEHNTPAAVSEFKSKGGLKRLYSAFFNSLEGFKVAYRQEHAFRQEVAVITLGVAVALLLPISIYQKLLLIVVQLFILMVELLNSAIEAVVDRISLDHHLLSKNAKDFGSAAVAIAIVIAAATWAVVLYDRFFL